MSILAVTMF